MKSTQTQTTALPPLQVTEDAPSPTTPALPIKRARRHSQDALEREARSAAERALRGQPPLAPFAETTPAPRQQLALAGRPLPAAVRVRFERAYQADLSRVRVHTGPQAHALAIQEDAQAVTAGPDIYFREGAYVPYSTSGLELLGHEIAHTVQQAAQWVGGVFAVRAMYGSGVLQPDEAYDLLKARQRPDSFDSKEQETQYDALVARVEKALGPDLSLTIEQGKTEEAQKLLKETVEERKYSPKTYSRAARSYLYDVLKFLGLYAGAAELLMRDPDLYIHRFDMGMYTWLRKKDNGYGGDNWAYGMVRRIRSTRRLYPEPLLDEIWRYLMTYDSEPKKISKWHAAFEQIDNTGMKQKMPPNEMHYLAHLALVWISNELHEVRMTQLGKARQVEQDNPIPPQNRQLNLAYDTRAYARHRRKEKVYPELDGLWEAIDRVADDAVNFWLRAMFLAERLDDPAQIDEYLPVPEDEAIRQYREQVYSAYKAILNPPDPYLLEPAAYQTALDALRTTLDTLQATLTARIGQVSTRGLETDSAQYRQGLWLGFLLSTLTDMRKKIDAYDAKKDQEFTDKGMTDIRLAHRIQLAADMSTLGQYTEWQEYAKLGTRVRKSEDLGFSYVALVGEWKVDDKAKIDDLETEFRPNRRPGGLPLTVGQFVQLYRLLYETNLNAAIEGLLKTRESKLEFDAEKPLLKTALEEAKQTPQPQRYIMPESVVVWSEKDRLNLVDLLRGRPAQPGQATTATSGHQRFHDDFVKKYVTANAAYLIPEYRTPQVFVWLLPGLSNLATTLRKMPRLNDVVKLYSGRKPKSLTNAEWFAAFASAVNYRDTLKQKTAPLTAQEREYLSKFEALFSKGIDEMEDSVRAERRSQATTLQTLLRRVTTRNRRILNKELGKRLREYNAEGKALFGNQLKLYGVPNDVLHAIETFSIYVQPKEDNAAQVAALVLDLAEELHGMFIIDTWLGTLQEERYDLVTGYYYLIVEAIKTAQEHPETIEAILHKGEGHLKKSLIEKRLKLEEIRASLDATIEKNQLRFGFKSTDGNTLMSLVYAQKLQPGEPYYYDGSEYVFHRVYKKFRYHPPYGENQAKTVKPGVLKDENGDPMPHDGTVLFEYQVNGSELIRVTAKDADDDRGHLARLSTTIEMIAFGLAMENLAETIEAAANLALDVVEFIPGAGQAVMVARALAEITRFVTTELPELKIDLIETPTQIIEELIAHFDITDLVNLETLWLFLLEGGSNPLATLKSKQRKKGRVRRKPKGKFAAILKGAGELALRVFTAFERLQFDLQSALIRAQAFVLSNRKLTGAVELIVELYPAVQLAAGFTRNQAREAFAAYYGKNLSWSVIKKDLQASVDEMMAGLYRIELPENVFPLDETLRLLLNFALRRFGTKGKAIALVLEATGADAKAVAAIREALIEGTDADPNVHWREKIYPAAEEYFTEARDQFVAGAYALISAVTAGAITKPEDGPPVTLQREAQPWLDDLFDEEPADPFDVPPLQQDGGHPLPATVRAHYEREYGHDFGHVRLHTDDHAADLTSAVGALALTSGSHIYLHPQLSLGTWRGLHIVRHELAHVLQQTGPRPVDGLGYDDVPAWGAPGRGLNTDVRAEATANQMAALAHRSREDDEPIAVLMAGVSGYQPALSDVVLRTLDKFLSVDDTSGKSFREGFAEKTRIRVPGATARLKLFKDARTLAFAIYDGVRKALTEQQTTTTITYDAPFGTSEGKKAIASYVSGLHASTEAGSLRAAIEPLTYHSFKKKDRKGLRLHQVFDADAFANDLEALFFVNSGLVLKITLNAQKKAKSVKLDYIHLGLTTRGSKLWQDAWTPSVAAAKGMVGLSASEKDAFEKSGRTVMEYIFSRVIDEPIWDANEYRLSDKYIKAAIAELLAVGEVKLPTWAEYTRADDLSSTAAGLRVATHGQLRRTVANMGGAQPIAEGAMSNRESHHLPQYLFVEYLRNKTSKLSEKAKERLPGFSPTSGKLFDQFGVNGSVKLNLSKLDPNSERGSGVPAISLAATTHQTGKLHVNHFGTWSENLEEHGSTTQSMLIDRRFWDKLRDAHPALSASNTKAEVATQYRGDSEGDDKVFAAIKTTYKEMYDYMFARLKTALVDIEIPYYKRAVRQLHEAGKKAPGNRSYMVNADTPAPEFKPDADTLSGDGGPIKAIQQKNKDYFSPLNP